MRDNTFFASLRTAGKCLLCSSEALTVSAPVGFQTGVFLPYRCKVCGNYAVEEVLKHNFEIRLAQDKLMLLRCITRTASEQNKPLFLDDDNYELILTGGNFPHDPIEAIDKLLMWIAGKINFQNESVNVHIEKDYPLFFAKQAGELSYWISSASTQELERLIDVTNSYQNGTSNLKLRHNGWLRVRELRRMPNKDSKQVFVAMSFDKEDDPIFLEGIRPALKHLKFEPVQLNHHEHNELIDDKIIAGIRKSKFIVADFKTQKSGVYFEAGFAFGLGLPVIYTCPTNEKSSLHFDVSHYPIIFWDSVEDLKRKLINRIEATIV